MRALVLGAAGVLGSALTERFLGMGLKVRALDVCRIDEAWRLAEVNESIEYLWKASTDLLVEDLRRVDIVVDCGIGVADRPLGNSSPFYTFAVNVNPSLHVLETARRLPVGKKPIMIYPSSFNALYGYPNESTYKRDMLPNPSSLYGWTKASVELLYLTYHRAYGVPCVISRVGSGYGPRMRSDELPARLILSSLKGREMNLRSPSAKRLWTYVEDILSFYESLVNNVDAHVGETLHCAGNLGDEIVTNLQLAKMIGKIAGRPLKVRNGSYEAGELVDGKPISFEVEGGTPLWKSRFTLKEGMTRTYRWFEENASRYV